jgi:large conductance mechanosensitive channel
MKNLLAEFKAFINKGDVVTIAVGLVMALYFKTIVDNVIAGIIDPIIAAIFGEATYTNIGFDIGDARLRIGLVIDAAIKFVAVAFVLFAVVKAYNAWKRRGDDDEAAPSGPTEVELLTDIRDALRSR